MILLTQALLVDRESTRKFVVIYGSLAYYSLQKQIFFAVRFRLGMFFIVGNLETTRLT